MGNENETSTTATEITNGLAHNNNSALWILLYLALGGGLGGGVFTVASTQDRYTQIDASRDFQLRDQRIQELTRRVTALEADNAELHREYMELALKDARREGAQND